MKKFNFCRGYIATYVGLATVLASSVAMAAPDLTTFTVDTTSVDTMAGIVLAGLAGLWGIRKLIKTINRS